MDIQLTEQDIYTVSRLNSAVRFLVEDSFPTIWVEGEISNFAAPHSGHWYFSLKDSGAQVRCALFKGNQRKLGFTPTNGMHVLLKARVSLYENRGEYQLIGEDMEERGTGKLRQAFEALKKKLEAAGLFDAAHKKPLPLFPARIGIVTSATGAAIRDVLTVLKRRYPALPIIIYPTLVQGTTAAPTIVQAIQLANQRKECDLLIVTRGGGSLEDLWPFNEEIVAQAIYQSDIPIISGIGHEIDFTIADFVADKRAPTPSAAAEIATPDSAELLLLLKRHQQQLVQSLKNTLQRMQQQMRWLHKHLGQQHPKKRLLEKMQRLDYCELHLIQLQTRLIHALHAKSGKLTAQLQQHSPQQLIQNRKQAVYMAEQQLLNGCKKQLGDKQLSLANLSAKLNALSPLATLARGFAIATDHANQRILTRANEVKLGMHIDVKLSQGVLNCRVEKIEG